MKPDTSHISATRRLWFEHLQQCETCYRARMWTVPLSCEQGQALYDEYIASVLANRHCEHLTATEATPCAKT